MPEELNNTSNDIGARVIAVVAKNQRLDPAVILASSTFAELEIDSLDGLQIVFALEEEFNIEIPDDAAQQFRSVGQVIEALEALLAKRSAAGA